MHSTLSAHWLRGLLLSSMKNDLLCPNTIIPKIGPPPKISPPPFFSEATAKGAFLSKVCPPICVKQDALKKCGAMQEEGVTMKADTIYCYCINKSTTSRITACVHNTARLTACVHNTARLTACVHNTARLTACEMAYFQDKYQLSKICPPVFEEPLKFITHGCIFRRLP